MILQPPRSPRTPHSFPTRRCSELASFEAVFSVFGVIMFPDWRKGLAEMARVKRPGGHGVIATWREHGAATFLLLGQNRRKLFPDREGMMMLPEAVTALSEPANFACELVAAGYRHPRLQPVHHHYLLTLPALRRPNPLFVISPH